MEINKSTRHHKIIGDCGEHLICNWLSRSGMEVTIVDHTGIDIIAFDPHRDIRMGISVKSRTRRKGTENDSVNFFKDSDREKVVNACKAFGCLPWLAAYVEAENHADIYLTSLDNFDKKYRREGKSVDAWKMDAASRQAYLSDQEVKHISIHFEPANWFY